MSNAEKMAQNMEVLLKMGKFTGITSKLGIPADQSNYIPLKNMPPIKAQAIIGTPGTISKWITARKLSMREVKILVFDEADHMLAEVVLFVGCCKFIFRLMYNSDSRFFGKCT